MFQAKIVQLMPVQGSLGEAGFSRIEMVSFAGSFEVVSDLKGNRDN
jgi:hypothetical protein